MSGDNAKHKLKTIDRIHAKSANLKLNEIQEEDEYQPKYLNDAVGLNDVAINGSEIKAKEEEDGIPEEENN